MHKSEHRVNPTLMNGAIKVYKLKWGTSSLKSNVEVDLISHYRKSTAFQYHV